MAESTLPEDAVEPGPEEESQPRRRRWRAGLREIGITVVVALILSILVKTFLLQPFWIPSGSMEDTLVPGDRVLVSKLTPGPFELKRGDIVVFEDPGGWLDPTASRPSSARRALQFIGLAPAGDDHLIKRVVGLPGDRVICCDPRGRLSVNGTPIDEPYVQRGNAPSAVDFDVTVPADRVWVIGDHRSNSSDSRFHDDGTGSTGSVPVSRITGRAVVTAWPLGRMGTLSNYSTTFDKVGQ